MGHAPGAGSRDFGDQDQGDSGGGAVCGHLRDGNLDGFTGQLAKLFQGFAKAVFVVGSARAGVGCEFTLTDPGAECVAVDLMNDRLAEGEALFLAHLLESLNGGYAEEIQYFLEGGNGICLRRQPTQLNHLLNG